MFLGDVHNHTSELAEALVAAARLRVDAVIQLGDLDWRRRRDHRTFSLRVPPFCRALPACPPT